MKKLLLSLLSLSVIFSIHAQDIRYPLSTNFSEQSVKPLLVLNQEWVKYPDYADRAGWDALLGDYKQEYIRAGERSLDYEWTHVKLTNFLEFERTGSRTAMQDPNSRNQSALSALFMAELAEGKGRFIDQIMNGVFFYCEKQSWVLSAHLNSQPGSGAVPRHTENYIDLGAGGVGAMLSWIYYYLAPEFDKQTDALAPFLRHELQVKILDSYLANTYFWWLATDYEDDQMVNNWNPWCNSNCLMAFMLLENDPEVLAKAVYKSMVSVDKFINYTKDDGACEEGPSYWGHAAGKMYDYLELLSQFSDGKISIFDSPKVKAMGEYIANSYVGDGWVVNFADASAKGGGDASLIYRYGVAVGSEQMKSYAKSMTRTERAPSTSDLFRGLEALDYAAQIEEYSVDYKPLPSVWYPQTEFCYMTNNAGMFLATKGGYNSESHNHNDAGTFSLYIDNMPIMIDIGVGTYTKFTFSDARYTIWTMQSNYHNLPLVNGAPQEFGAQYKAKNSSFDSRRNIFSADIAGAYPAEAGIKSWVRSYALTPKSLKISDSFSLDAPTTANQVNFMTWGDVDIATPGVVTIEVDGVKAQLKYNSKLFSATIETVELTDPRLSGVWGDEVYRVSLNAKSITARGKYDFEISQVK